MPLGVKPKCNVCKISFSVMWRKNECGEIVCNSCSVRPPADQKRTSSTLNLRKSTRSRVGRLKASKNQHTGKGKGRRSLVFKKNPPKKAPSSDAAVTVTSNFFYKGQFYQVGDIVSIVNQDDAICYAQIHGLAIDEYGGKCAYLSWLIPRISSFSEEYFNPDSYRLGEKDEIPRKLSYLTFVCHSPPEFYKRNVTEPLSPTDAGFVWTSIGPRILRSPTQAEVFGTESSKTVRIRCHTTPDGLEKNKLETMLADQHANEQPSGSGSKPTCHLLESDSSE